MHAVSLLEPAETQCPYCGERLTLVIDCSAGAQSYVEDCQVCCRPMLVFVAIGNDGLPHIEARRDDE